MKGGGSGKSKSKWALQPPTSSSSAFSDVIEISARTSESGAVAMRRSDDEDEQRERERLREAAAQSIGIGSLMREEGSSRVESSSSRDSTELEEDDDVGMDTLTEEGHANERRATEKQKMRSIKANTVAGLHLHGLSTIGARSHRSASITAGVAAPIPKSPRDRSTIGYLSSSNGNGSGTVRAPTPTTPSQLQTHLPDFPCTYAALASYTQVEATLPKHYPPPSLLMYALARQWRSRAILFTSPKVIPSPMPSFGGGGRSSLSPAAFHLHLFKSTAAEERELERLEINEHSVVFVTGTEVAGRRNVVKVGGVDVGLRRKDLNAEEAGRTLWLLQIVDAEKAQQWIAAIKNAVLVQRCGQS